MADGKPSRPEQPYLGVHFDCCGVYTRIYKNKEGTKYVGWCPRCMRKLEVRCGEGGSDQRMFRAH